MVRNTYGSRKSAVEALLHSRNTDFDRLLISVGLELPTIDLSSDKLNNPFNVNLTLASIPTRLSSVGDIINGLQYLSEDLLGIEIQGNNYVSQNRMTYAQVSSHVSLAEFLFVDGVDVSVKDSVTSITALVQEISELAITLVVDESNSSPYQFVTNKNITLLLETYHFINALKTI